MSQYLPKAERVAKVVPQVLENRGLEPLITDYLLADLTNENKGAWLFVVLDDKRIPKIERYAHPQTIHQISTAAGGLPVVWSNSTGARYAVLLSDKPALPNDVAFPGYRKGLIQFGVSHRGEAVTRYDEIGSILAAGVTRYGKSNLLRLITAQVLAEGHQAIFVDPQGDTWPFEMQDHPQVLATGFDLKAAPAAVGRAVEEYHRRNNIVTQARKAGATRPVFPRLFVFIDEFNGLLRNYDGERGELAGAIFSLGFGALKYGIHLVIGGHEFTQKEVGPIASQLVTRFCFKVERPSIGRVVVGSETPFSIKVKGRALARPFGKVQVYRMDESAFLQAVGGGLPGGLTQAERDFIDYLNREAGGKLTYAALTARGLSQSEADKLRRDWVTRGLAVHAPKENNSIVLADKYRKG